MQFRGSLLLLSAGWLGCLDYAMAAEAPADGAMLGFYAPGVRQERDWERQFDGHLDAAQMHGWLREMSDEPNQVGSPHDLANAQSILRQFTSWGWQAKIETFSALYPTSLKQSLQLLGPRGFNAALREPPIRSDAQTLPLEEGLLYETELANRTKVTVESKALIHVFLAERNTRKVPGLPAPGSYPKIVSAGVIGAGTMGGGIAICFANAGVPVTVLESSQEALDPGFGVVTKTYDSMVKRGTLNYSDLAAADVVIEAVFESLALKQKIFKELDAIAKPGAVLATNTSTLDIDAIAAVTLRPENVVGLHFFAPANVMPLLEVVRTDITAPVIIAATLDLAKQLKKTPVLARVCYGFIGNRMMEGYAREAQRMVLEGATPRQVDAALETWGMAMGILAVFDMAGIDVGINVHTANAERYPPDPSYYQADVALHAAGRFGQKNGNGYYKYLPGDRTRLEDPEAINILKATARKLDIPQRIHGADEIVERCVYPLINEEMRILEEGVATRASDVDVVWCAGYGFPRYRGAPLFYADTIGLKTVYDAILKYRDQFGPMHWQPAPLLERLVSEGRTLADWQAERI